MKFVTRRRSRRQSKVNINMFKSDLFIVGVRSAVELQKEEKDLLTH